VIRFVNRFEGYKSIRAIDPEPVKRNKNSCIENRINFMMK
jgi:hypothetical protein